jgi:acyl carrier protein
MTVRARLRDCFAAVFPSAAPGELEQASTETLTDWDSLATVRLVAVVEEEFEVVLELEDLEQLNSFERVYHLVEARLAGA